MNWLHTAILLLVVFLAVFAEATVNPVRYWLGAQLDLLPSLMVYAAARTDLRTIGLVAVLGGLWADSLSANPLGTSILPLFWVGWALHRWRDLLLRELAYAQFFFGGFASAAVPLLTLVLLWTAGEHPLIGWGSLWQLLVMVAGGAVFTPLCFLGLEGLHRAFAYQPVPTTAFRLDREIKRGRH